MLNKLGPQEKQRHPVGVSPSENLSIAMTKIFVVNCIHARCFEVTKRPTRTGKMVGTNKAVPTGCLHIKVLRERATEVAGDVPYDF